MDRTSNVNNRGNARARNTLSVEVENSFRNREVRQFASLEHRAMHHNTLRQAVCPQTLAMHHNNYFVPSYICPQRLILV